MRFPSQAFQAAEFGMRNQWVQDSRLVVFSLKK
jgi:hypothetical protein